MVHRVTDGTTHLIETFPDQQQFKREQDGQISLSSSSIYLVVSPRRLRPPSVHPVEEFLNLGVMSYYKSLGSGSRRNRIP